MRLISSLLTILLIVSANCTLSKFVWVYWSSGVENMPPLYRDCYLQLKNQLKDTIWDIKELNDENLKDYATPESLAKILKISDSHENQFDFSIKKEYIRLSILYDFGGVWLDPGVILLESLDWLDQLQTNQNVFNKFGE